MCRRRLRNCCPFRGVLTASGADKSSGCLPHMSQCQSYEHMLPLDFGRSAIGFLSRGIESNAFSSIAGDCGRLMCHTVDYSLAAAPRLSSKANLVIRYCFL